MRELIITHPGELETIALDLSRLLNPDLDAFVDNDGSVVFASCVASTMWRVPVWLTGNEDLSTPIGRERLCVAFKRKGWALRRARPQESFSSSWDAILDED